MMSTAWPQYPWCTSPRGTTSLSKFQHLSSTVIVVDQLLSDELLAPHYQETWSLSLCQSHYQNPCQITCFQIAQSKWEKEIKFMDLEGSEFLVIPCYSLQMTLHQEQFWLRMGRFHRFPTSCKSSSNASPGFLLQYIFVLHPSFNQIFLTVGLGWVTGAVGLLGPQEVLSCSNLWRKVILWCKVHGLGVFTAKFSLPALIFLSLSTIDLANTRWSFILAMFVTKSLVFLLVFFTDFLLKRDLSRAVLFAISSTQTNDFGLGRLFLS